MNLLDSIDKSAYTLLFSDETEMSPYGASGTTGAGAVGPPVRSRTYVAESSPSQTTTATTTTTTSLSKPAANSNPTATTAPLTSNGGVVKSHTVLNMKTTLVNGDNCDTTSKCESEPEEESHERKPLMPTVVATTQEKPPDEQTNASSNISLDHNSSYDLMSHSSGFRTSPPPNNIQDQYNFEEMLNPSSSQNVGSMSKQQPVQQPHHYNAGCVNDAQLPSTSSKANWGPDSFSSNLSSSSTVVAGASGACSSFYTVEGQKILPPPNYIKDYSNIFGHLANSYYETEEPSGDVAKLPINNPSQEKNQMFLIGLSSNVDDDNNDDDDDYDDERDLMDNEDQFQSATEDFNYHGDGEHDRGGDQDPLLVRPPSKQNVFHQFIRSATKSTRNNRRPSRNGKHHNSFGKEGQGSSRETCSSSALIKEVHPPHHQHNQANDTDPGDDISAGSSTTEGIRPGRRCSIGILLAAISCVFFATSALIVKISSLHPMELLAVRGMIQGILISPIVISTGNSFLGPSGSRSLLLARAVLGAVALVMGFASIHLIQLSDAATVIFTSPVFVSIFACMCLGEVCSWFDVSMIALTLVGVLLVSKPSFTFLSTGSWTGIVGTICGLIAAMLTALAFIVLRQLKQVHYSVTVFWFSSVLATFGAVLTVALDGFTLPRTWAAVMECVGIGFCGFMGQILLTKALQTENALPIAVTRTFDIVLAFFYQITLLHDTPDWYSYLGSVLVVSCVLLTAFRRWYKESLTKKYQRVHKVSDDEPIPVDDGLLHESSSSPPPIPPRQQHSSRHHHHLHNPNPGTFS